VLALGLLISSGVLAISDPDSVTIAQVYVFGDVLETGDQLFYARYDVNYNSTPDEDAQDTWQMAVYDINGTLVASRPLNYFQHNIISIYLEPDEAIEEGLAHQVKIMGSPSVFPSLVEGTNMRTSTLAAGDYLEGGDVGDYMITEAGILETDWGLTLLTSSDKLNSTGSTYFLEAIPGLASMDPTIFQTATRVLSPADPTWEPVYPDDIIARSGGGLQAAINGTMSIFGIYDPFWGTAWVSAILFMLIGAPIYAVTRQPVWAAAVGFPIMLVVAWLGAPAVYFYWLLAIVAVLAIMFGVTALLRHFG
jgi:hypothetical protein